MDRFDGSVRHGCPMTALFELIRQNIKIKKIKNSNKNNKIKRKYNK
jgi:hypothetical protein